MAGRHRATLWPVPMTLHSSSLRLSSQHQQQMDLLLPNHPPEVSDRVWQRTLWANVPSYYSARLRITTGQRHLYNQRTQIQVEGFSFLELCPAGLHPSRQNGMDWVCMKGQGFNESIQQQVTVDGNQMLILWKADRLILIRLRFYIRPDTR